MEAVLGAIDALPFEAPADTTYARIRTQLEKSPQPYRRLHTRKRQ